VPGIALVSLYAAPVGQSEGIGASGLVYSGAKVQPHSKRVIPTGRKNACLFISLIP
jgi:hypothetical protein